MSTQTKISACPDILIKISFSTEGIVNNALIIGAVLFGFLILLIHNKFENNAVPNKS